MAPHTYHNGCKYNGSQTTFFHFKSHIFGIHLIAVVLGPCTNQRGVEQDVKRAMVAPTVETTRALLYTRLVYTNWVPHSHRLVRSGCYGKRPPAEVFWDWMCEKYSNDIFWKLK